MKTAIVLMAVVVVALPALAERPVLTARPIDMQNMGQVTIGPAGGPDFDATVVYSNTTNETGFADVGTAPDGQTYWGDDFVMIAGGRLDEVKVSVAMFDAGPGEVCTTLEIHAAFFSADGLYTPIAEVYGIGDFTTFPCGGLSNDPGCSNGALLTFSNLAQYAIDLPAEVIGATMYTNPVFTGGPGTLATFGPSIMQEPTVGTSDPEKVYISFDGGLSFGVYWYGLGEWANYYYEVSIEGTGPLPCPGDFDCDGDRDFDDIDPFVAALGTGQCQCPNFANCDPNGDGQITFDDIDPFIAVLGTPCP